MAKRQSDRFFKCMCHNSILRLSIKTCPWPTCLACTGSASPLVSDESVAISHSFGAPGWDPQLRFWRLSRRPSRPGLWNFEGALGGPMSRYLKRGTQDSLVSLLNPPPRPPSVTRRPSLKSLVVGPILVKLPFTKGTRNCQMSVNIHDSSKPGSDQDPSVSVDLIRPPPYKALERPSNALCEPFRAFKGPCRPLNGRGEIRHTKPLKETALSSSSRAKGFIRPAKGLLRYPTIL
jgi:hypothetical protein